MTTPLAPLSVLFVGGTGTISSACVRRAVAAGMTVTVLNRGRNAQRRDLPDGVEWITADVTDPSSVASAIDGRRFDAVASFLCFTGADARWAVDVFTGHTAQYLHISTASLYAKPVLQVPIVESTPRGNAYVAYSRQKIEAEDVFLDAHADRGFPVTIVRPSHTYDEASPPLPGGWTIVDRMLRGDDIVVHGDGTSLWTVTHADDFALGFVGLIGNPRAVGETFHITSDDVYNWEQIYLMVGAAFGVRPKLVHLPSEFFVLGAPEWGWSELLMGDLGHSAIFDNTKIRRFVPGYAPTQTLHRSLRRMVRWREEHPELARGDAEAEAVFDRMAAGYHRARALFAPDGASA